MSVLSILVVNIGNISHIGNVGLNIGRYYMVNIVLDT